MMVIAIDTCGPVGSIAFGMLENSGVSVIAQAELAGKTYAAELLPTLRRLLAACGTRLRSLDAVVVVNGPGSFTGIRIGVASAKGLAEALRIPLLAVSRLAVLAWKAGAEQSALDAGRNEVYFRDGSDGALLALNDASRFGGVAVCEATLLREFPEAVLIEVPTAGDALKFSEPWLIASDFADVATVNGNYVRRSDAEIFAKPVGEA